MDDINKWNEEIESGIPAVKQDEQQKQEYEQRTIEWHLARLDKFTGSRIPDLMKQGRGKGQEWGLTAQKIILEMVTLQMMTEEGRLQYVEQNMYNDFKQTRWGNDNEAAARDAYAEKMKFIVKETGFMVNPKCEYHGGSFDGEVLEKVNSIPERTGIIEIKCPFDPVKHLMNMNLQRTGLDAKHEYYGQIQSNIETAGVDWCDFVSFDPRQSPENQLVIIRVERNQMYIDAMMDRIHAAKRILDGFMSGMTIEKAILTASEVDA